MKLPFLKYQQRIGELSTQDMDALLKALDLGINAAKSELERKRLIEERKTLEAQRAYLEAQQRGSSGGGGFKMSEVIPWVLSLGLLATGIVMVAKKKSKK